MQVSPVKFLIPHSHSLLKGLIILQSDGYVLILFTILFVAYFLEVCSRKLGNYMLLRFIRFWPINYIDSFSWHHF